MSFVPLSGPATLRAAESPRDGVVEFTDAAAGSRTITLPIRAALPVLAKARTDEAAHPSVTLLAAASLLAMRFVAAGKFEPGDGVWRLAPLDADDTERLRRLAESRAYAGLPAADAEHVVRRLVDAVVDTMPRACPGRVHARDRSAPPPRAPRPEGDAFSRRLQALVARHRGEAADLPQLVTLSLRVEAHEEELVAGSCRLVLQVHDEQDPLHVCDAGALWHDAPSVHGFGDRARTHASLALREAAAAWPPLERLLEQRVPDELALTTDDLVSLLEDGVEALHRGGVDVLWPRSLGRDLKATATLDRVPSRREGQLVEGVLSGDALFAFNWQVALRGEPLTEAEMDALARASSPMLRLRGGWTVVDPSVARKARSRLIRTVKPAQAVAAALTGVVDIDDAPAEVVVGASLLTVREQLLDAATAPPLPTPPGLAAVLRDYQRQGFTWLERVTSLGLGACLADDMGLGKTVTLIALHLHRAAARPGPTLVVCPASLLGNWEAEIRRFAPGVDVRRFHGGQRSLDDLAPDRRRARSRLRAHHLRHRPARRRYAGRRRVGAGRRRRGAARQERPLRHRPRPAHGPVRGPGRPHRHPGREQPDRALGDPRLGDARAARQPPGVPQGLGRPDRVRPRADQGAAVRRPDRPVPAAAPQVRPRHRPRAARQDRDRPPARADPRAGRPLRVVRPRHDGAHRARRRGHPPRPGPQAPDRAQADLQPPGPLPQAVRRPALPAGPRSSTCSTSSSPPPWPRTARCWSSRSTSRWPG